MNIIESFGVRLKNLRRQNGLSQEKLAEISGLHRTYISSLERGSRNPTLTTLNTIAKSLNIKIDLLVSGISDE